MSKSTVIVDIDGTIFTPSQARLDLLKQRPVNWDAFYKMDFAHDEPLPEFVLYVKMLGLYHQLVFMTSRLLSVQADTLYLLRQYVDQDFDLVMREAGDDRPDYLTKQALYLEYLQRKNVVLAIDDSDNVLKMWKSLGIRTLKAKDGKIYE